VSYGKRLELMEKLFISRILSGFECARPGFYGIYTRVSTFIPWIEKKLKE